MRLCEKLPSLGEACAGLDPVAGVQEMLFNKIKEVWIPAFAGMTPGLFICEFLRSLARYIISGD